MTALKDMNDAFKMMMNPEYADKPSDERAKILKAAKGKIAVAEEKFRGGKREGAGRKKMKPGLKKRTKSFTLSPETVEALKNLEVMLGLSSQSALVEFLALKAFRELDGDNRNVVERQEELF